MRCIKVCISLLLIICMVFSIPAEAAVNWSAATVDRSGQVSDADKGGHKGEYAEGEAIILYRESTVSPRTALSAQGLGRDMQIKETYDFGSAPAGVTDQSADEEAGISAQARKSLQAGASQTLKVSLVKSDTYSTEELIDKLGARKDILAVEPNYRIHILEQGEDPYAQFQWALDNQGQNKGTKGLDVKPQQKILDSATSDEECVVALVDTGLDYTHEDLKNVVWTNPIQTNQLRGLYGYDFVNQDTDPMDDNGHGSHCAGIMAAECNSVGIRGIAKNPKIKIMALKVLDETGSSYGMETVAAYNYIYKAQQFGVNVVAVNNSWGGQSEEESKIFKTLIELVGEKGAVSVCAAGNDSYDGDSIWQFPSGIDSEYILSVAASNENDDLAAFSNYGRESVDLAAPGTDILSSVSYDCFNPGIYENPQELCSIYEDFSDGRLVQAVTADDGEIAYGYAEDSGNARLSLELSDEAYFGLQGGQEKSLKWTVSGAKEGETYTLYFPYIAGVSDTETYDSIMVKAVGPEPVGEDAETSMVLANDLELMKDGVLESKTIMELVMECINGVNVDKGNYWNHISGVALSERRKAGKRALAVTLVVAADGDYEIYLDNLGISKENIASEKFGKYDYFNGTSMAAPYVTGAAAAVSSAFPQESARDVKEHILGCTRTSSALHGKVATAGVLDLSKVELPTVYIRGISLDNNRNIRIEGKNLSGAKVTINSKAVTPQEHTENVVVLNSAGYLNQFLDIAVTVGEKVISEQHFFAAGAGFSKVGRTYGMPGEVSAVSDGERIYYVDKEGTVYMCVPDMEDEMGEILWSDGMYVYTTEMFGVDENLLEDHTISNLSEIIYLDNRLWTVLKLDMKYTEERILACFSMEEGWTLASKLPEEFETAEGISIAPYQGKLYLLGGLDNTTGNLQSCVMRMDPLTMKWQKSTALPEARAFAQAVATGDKLVVTLGKNQQGTFPHTMVFNGRSWSVSKAELAGIEANYTYYYQNPKMEEKEVSYFGSWVGAVGGGVVYAGLVAPGLGDTFFYQISSDKYTAANYAVSNTAVEKNALVQAAVMRDKLYLMAQGKEGSEIFAMPVKSACVEVVAPNMSVEEEEKGTISGIYHYIPGDVFNILAEPAYECFVKQFTVDGKNAVKRPDGKYLYRSPVDATKGKVMVDVKFASYVTYIEMEEAVALYPGQKYEIYRDIYPYDADNQELIWSSSKPGIVKVKNGTVTVSKKAKRGSSAIITAAAADRKTVKATCRVDVIKAPLPEKNEVVSVGKLEYKVTSSSAKKKTVDCSGFAGKAVTSVKIPSTVKINSYTFKVTGVAKNAFAKNKKIKNVTIGSNVTSVGQGAFENCKSLKSVQIKGKSLKKVGKNAFKGISKKAIVRVPAKQKKPYTSKLRKSGYTGKIK